MMWYLRFALLVIVFGSFADQSCAEDLAAREARLLSQVKAGNDVELRELAEVREQRGNLGQAIATWGLIGKLWRQREVPHLSQAQDYSYGQLAKFEIHRLQRKRNLAARPPRPDRQLEIRLQKWLREHTFFALEKEGNYDLLVQADLDGDYVDEVFFRGRYGELGARDEPFMGIAKWNGTRYQVVYRASGRDNSKRAAAYWIMDKNGDGWKDVLLGFTPETDDVAIVIFNGKDARIQ